MNGIDLIQNLTLALIGLIFIAITFHTVIRFIRYFYKFPIPAPLTILIDHPIRRKYWQKPQKLAKRMQLKSGQTLLEVGPGRGNYTEYFSKVINPGKLYAIDIQESVINRLKKKVEEKGLDNIEPQVENIYHLPFEDASVDRIFMMACLPEIPDPIRALKECRRVLNDDGIVSFSEIFTDPDYPLRRTEIRWANQAGFDLSEKFGNWFIYQLNFMKSKQ
ncbi:MAG: class I SAM-dependent methyltransferase [Candidatus Thorarchaeota archaeon]